MANDVFTLGKVFFETSEPLFFCHPVRDPLTMDLLDNLEVKGFLWNDKTKA
jgi:hypothetical protein